MRELAYTVRVDKPNPAFGRTLQEAIGDPKGELRVMTNTWSSVQPLGRDGTETRSGHTRTKTQAVIRAREIVRNLGRRRDPDQDEKGHFIDSDTVKGPRHQESRARDRK